MTFLGRANDISKPLGHWIGKVDRNGRPGWVVIPVEKFSVDGHMFAHRVAGPNVHAVILPGPGAAFENATPYLFIVNLERKALSQKLLTRLRERGFLRSWERISFFKKAKAARIYIEDGRVPFQEVEASVGAVVAQKAEDETKEK